MFTHIIIGVLIKIIFCYHISHNFSRLIIISQISYIFLKKFNVNNLKIYIFGIMTFKILCVNSQIAISL